MLSTKNLYLFGYSGHAYVVIDVALSVGFNIGGYFNLKPTTHNPYNIAYLGDEQEENLQNIVGKSSVFAAIGSNSIRKKLMTDSNFKNLNFAVLTDPAARISKLASVAEGSLICTNAVLQSKSTIGRGCIVNTGAIVEHECKIGPYSHIAPGAVLAGNVQIGEKVFVGANATIKEGITIGNDVVIGAGAVIIKDIPPNQTWAGNPGRAL